MGNNIMYQVINSPENPYGRNAYRIQQEAMLRKMRKMQMEQPSNLERAVDISSSK